MKRFWKRNKLLVLTLLVLTLFVGSTYAYLVASDFQIINTFKFAQIDTGIEETVGNEFEKVVRVANKKSSPVYVRARVVVSGADADVAAVTFKEGQPQGAAAPAGKTIEVYWNNLGWVEDNGWYYYKQVLAGATGDTATRTDPLIYAVYVGTEVDQSATFEVDIYEESALTSAESFQLDAAKAAFGSQTTP